MSDLKVSSNMNSSNGGYGNPNPGYGNPNPGYGNPNPGYGNPNPGYGNPNPGYGNPNPGYGNPNPGYGYPNPGYGNPNPGYGYPNPGYNNPNPGYTDPGYGSRSMPNNGGYNPGYSNPGYSNTTVNVNVVNSAPVGQLRTDRGLLKYILLSAITCGIYGLICMGNMTDDLNTIASRYDNRRTMNFYLLTFLVAPITLGIGAIVWQHKMCARMGDELNRRGINYPFGAGTFWGWGVLGGLILVGPLVFMHKFFTAMNKLAADYNVRG